MNITIINTDEPSVSITGETTDNARLTEAVRAHFGRIQAAAGKGASLAGSYGRNKLSVRASGKHVESVRISEAQPEVKLAALAASVIGALKDAPYTRITLEVSGSLESQLASKFEAQPVVKAAEAAVTK